MDLHIQSTLDNAARVLKALRTFGAPLDDLTEKDLSTPGTVYQIGLSPYRIDILILIDGVGFDSAWKNRLEIKIDRMTVPIIAREDLIRNKKAVGRPQDLADVEQLLKMECGE